jgi:RNA polymerase sigma factor (sigma-70 family)
MESLGVNPGSEPEELVVARWESKQVLEALSRLNATDREILRMAAWEELSHAEIANALDVGVDVVRQRFYQARKNATREFNRLEKRRKVSPAAQKGGAW